MKKCFHKIFTKFTGKQLYQILFFSKVVTLRPEFIKKETPTQVIFCEFCNIYKKTFFTEHIWELFLGLIAQTEYPENFNRIPQKPSEISSRSWIGNLVME